MVSSPTAVHAAVEYVSQDELGHMGLRSLLNLFFWFQMAKDPAYLKEAILTDDGNVNVPQHSSGSHFGGGTSRNRTVGRGMRSVSSKVRKLS